MYLLYCYYAFIDYCIVILTTELPNIKKSNIGGSIVGGSIVGGLIVGGSIVRGSIKDGFSIFHLGGVDKSWGGVIWYLITSSLGGASRRLTRVNFFLTLGCSLGVTLLTQFKTYYSFHYS